ncbi:unnamed protein product [Notodromas monacha]|uniref:Uncharacterized protein n=1 Tax=Notodromas monacha TaxID=399045 RepID=A0A7R9G9N1_9CRUS|nr:unnamed protein product [Notodromas monacha]CAG0913073.1 unnamed protein product [Notodromas monacha]
MKDRRLIEEFDFRCLFFSGYPRDRERSPFPEPEGPTRTQRVWHDRLIPHNAYTKTTRKRNKKEDGSTWHPGKTLSYICPGKEMEEWGLERERGRIHGRLKQNVEAARLAKAAAGFFGA